MMDETNARMREQKKHTQKHVPANVRMVLTREGMVDHRLVVVASLLLLMMMTMMH